MTPERLAEISLTPITSQFQATATIQELLDTCRDLMRERDEQRKAADHWFKEANNRHNAIVKEIEAENARLREALAACTCRKKSQNVRERFEQQFEKTDTCWNWKGAESATGYGKMSVNNQPKLAHRVSYEIHKGPLQGWDVLDHLCRNRMCVNPDHLEKVSPRENVRRGTSPSAINAAKTHCSNGHPFDEKNTRHTPKGHRKCRKCVVVASRKRRARKSLEEKCHKS